MSVDVYILLRGLRFDVNSVEQGGTVDYVVVPVHHADDIGNGPGLEIGPFSTAFSTGGAGTIRRHPSHWRQFVAEELPTAAIAELAAGSPAVDATALCVVFPDLSVIDFK